MGQLIYTREYFAELDRKMEQRPHRCRQCKIADGAHPLQKNGQLMKFSAVVRFALIDPTRSANDASNVDLYCTRCRKPLEVWRTPRRIKPSKLAQLF